MRLQTVVLKTLVLNNMSLRGETTPEVMIVNDMPIGLLMALSENENAMRRFAMLTEEERGQIISQARQAASRDEMKSIVSGLN